ncbi:MAG: BMP family ABC transporter substrate-binding protein [Spirochaetaceae bacterium]|jgi:basic membrane protein A|nr:BMP family ABC transporter substrate-binding protein [Spirochaetaceae bacterium]
MKRKLLAAVLAALGLFLVAGCNKKAEVPAAGAAAPAEKAFKVVYLVNGGLGDKGFFDSAAAGLRRIADELGCETNIIEMGRNETSYESYFLDESEKDWDLIISGTWSVSELTHEIAAQFPDKNYLFFDGEVDFSKVPSKNIIGLTYKSNETGFMAGCLAARMLVSGAQKVEPNRKILGFVGSMDVPNINDFLIGYMEGIKYIDPGIKLLTSYVGSFEDVPKCLEMTTQLYNQGAQIVYAPASQSILGAVTASSNKDKYLIACDTDIWDIMRDTDAALVRNVISSSLKNLGDSLLVAVRDYRNGAKQMGENYVMGIETGAVGLADNDNYRAVVPAEARDEMVQIAGRIAAGEIKVGTSFGMETAEVANLRNAMKP